MEKKDITLKSSSEREQNQLAGSAEHEKIKGSQNLNMPNLRFPEFSGEWVETTIGDVAPLQRGFDLPTKDVIEGTYPVVYSNGILRNHKYYKCEAPGLITGRSGSIGNFTYINEGKYWPHNTSLWVTNFNNNYPLFIYYLYQTIDISQYSSGSSVPTLNRNDVHKHTVSLPEYNEQTKIADFLAKIDERIETQKKIIEKYESLIRGLSNKLLDASKGTSVRLGDILIERSERTKRNNQHEVLSSTVKGIFSQREYFSKDIASENNVGYKVIRRNDVVLSPQNLWMGNINYNDKFDIGIVSPSYKIFSIAEGYDKRFASALLKTHRALYNYMQVSEQGASVVRRNLNMEAFEQLTFKIPPYTKQCEIGRILDSMQNRLGLAISTQICLEQQKQWLLRNLFI